MSVKGSITTADFLPFDDYQRLLRGLESDGKYQWCLYCTLSFCLGLRVSDVLKLKWQDILNQNCIVVQEKKTRKVKPIPIGRDACKMVRDMYAKLGSPKASEFIFKNQYDGKAVTRQYINRIVKTWIPTYNLPIRNFSTHTFRKTFGRYVYESKGRTEEALIILMHIFRHSSIKITKIYIGLTADEVGDIFSGIHLI